MRKIIRPFLFLLFVLAIFTVAYADDLWGPPDDPFDPNWIPDGGGQKNTKSSDTALTISQLIHSEFPTITTYVDVVDENGDPIPGLTESDFCVYQDGQPVGSFTVDSILGDSCYTSVCLVMDVSGSMCTGFPNNSLEGAKIAAHEFVNNMDPFDRVSIVTFSNCVSTLIDFTSNQDSLHDAIDGLYCQGWTAAFDGIWMGVDNAATELGSKAVIAFTDGMENRSQYCWPPPDGLAWDSDYSDDSTIICDKANAAGVPIFTIGLGVADSIAEPLEAFADGTGGFYTFAPTANEMEFVYTTIKERICKRYIITYTSPDTIQDGDLHEVVICMNTDGTCDFGSDSFCDTSYYQETAPPEITQTPATMELQDTCQPVATAITICADVTDLADPPVQSVQLFYRKEGTASYTSVEMTGSPYCADIPASVVGAGPGVEYYIVASDGEQTVSDPPFSQNPQNNPYYIEICANLPPVCSVPDDTTIVQCTIAEVCLPVSCSDPDGNLVSGPTIMSGPGNIVGGNWCYTPSGDEVAVVTIRCTDIVDEFCEATFQVTFDVNEAPVCSAPADTSIFLCQSQEVCLPVSASDPDGNLDACVITSGPGTLNGGNWCYTPTADEAVTITVKCTDECGEFCEETFTVQFDINEAPVCSLPGDTSIFMCEAAEICLPASATDADGNLTGCEVTSGPGSIVGGNWCYTPTADGSYTVVIRCSDDCGAFCEESFDISIDINEAPVCELPDDQSFLLCDDSSFSFPISATDADGNLVGCTMTSGSGSFDGSTWSFTTSGAGVYSAAFECIDECDATCGGTVQIMIAVNSPPMLTCPADVVLDCAESTDPSNTGTATAIDEDSPTPTVTYTDTETPGSCPQEKVISRRWKAVDNCGDSAVCVQTITVNDDIAPVITCPASLTIDCSESTDPSNTGVATATDNCDTDPDVTYADSQTGDVITRTWTATDDCGNSVQCVQTVTIEDTTPPVVTCPDDVAVQCAADIPAVDIGAVSVTDDCDPNPTVVHVGDVSDGNSCPEVITRTYKATDESGNFTECQQIITINDTTDPVITCPADVDVECDGPSDPSATGFATATDNCDADPDVTYADSQTGDVITRTWTATDDCGNSVQCVQTVTIIPNDPPVCNLPDDQTFFVCDDSTFTFAVSATDVQDITCVMTSGVGSFDGSTWSFTTSGPGTYSASFECTDVCGASCQGTATMTVEYNSAPICFIPADTAIFQCEAAEVCLPVYAEDPDNNLADCQVVSGPGTIINGEWCYTPSGSETAVVTVACTDECGEFCEATLQVEFTIHDRWAVLTIDQSGSMALPDLSGQSRLYRAKLLAHDELDQLLDPADTDYPGVFEVSVMSFNETYGLVLHHDFSTDPAALHDAIDQIVNPRHDTPLAAAMCQAHCNMPELAGCLNYMFTYTDGLENKSQNFDICGLCVPCNQYMNTGWNYDCDPNNPSGCTDWQMCLYNVYAASGTNMVHYFGDPINPYVKDNPPVDMYFLMAASENSDGEFTYHSDQEAPPYTCGDVNSDFAVNVSDAVFVINYVFIGGEAPEPLIAGDTNCDGAVNVSDAVYIINYVFIGGSEPCDPDSDGSPDC